MEDHLYWYEITVERVIDGDSVWALIDLGYDTHIRKNCRLAGIDAPDRGEREYDVSAAALDDFLTKAENIYVRSVEIGKYGRPLCEVWVDGHPDYDGLVFVNGEMLEQGYAEPYEG